MRAGGTPSGAGSPRAVRAEVMKVARLLGVPAEQLSYLEGMPVADLRLLRERVIELLFDASEGLERLALASRLLPTSIIALIAEHAFGPVLTARIAGLLEPARAAHVASKLPVSFLAETALHLDPRRATALLTLMPAERIAEVAGALAATGEDVTLGRFVGHLPDRSIELALRQMNDEDVLRTAFVLEDQSAIERVLALLDQDRLDNLLATAEGTELQADAEQLLDEVGEPIRSRLVSRRAIRVSSGGEEPRR